MHMVLNTTASNADPDNGCLGGYLDDVWNFFVDAGTPVEQCDPYTHCAVPRNANCSSSSSSTAGLSGARPGWPVCPIDRAHGGTGLCADGSAIRTYKAESAYAVTTPGNDPATNVLKMQAEIMKHGPVRKTPLLSHFYTKNDHFTKTGSGQT
jgi:hypothetical protein